MCKVYSRFVQSSSDMTKFRPPGWCNSGRIAQKQYRETPMRMLQSSCPLFLLPQVGSAFQRTTGPGALDWKYVRMWGPSFSGAPTRRQRLSPVKNQRDEEQRQPGTMRSRLPRTACLLRLAALCILLAHSAAYFGSVSLLVCPTFIINWMFLLFLFQQKHDCFTLSIMAKLRTRNLTHCERLHLCAAQKLPFHKTFF